MREFVHLHLHTEYSLLDGATRLNQLFKRCDELNMPAVAITDHGNMFGAFEFYKQAVKYTDDKIDVFDFASSGQQFKVKPIIGCEFYTAPDMTIKESRDGRMPKSNHLVLLAKNKIGYKNLIKLVSEGWTKGFYYKPRIDFNLLRQHSEGLICLSACLAGELPQAILNGDLTEADKVVKKFKAIFKDDYYIEIQNHEIADQKRIIPYLLDIAKKNNVEIVATNDVHYLNKEDAEMQKVLQCISFRSTMPEDGVDDGSLKDESAGGDGGYFPTKEFYLKSGDEMDALFKNVGNCIDITKKIADKCECDFFSKEPLMPLFEVKEGNDLGVIPTEDKGKASAEYLRRLTKKGLEQKYIEVTPEIEQRAAYELDTIIDLGFADYFLIVWEFINWSENHGIAVGPGRGSGVGSIVAYAIGITKIDPLKYQLFFERFLNRERVSNPDFDIDFCVIGRERVIEHVVELYGKDNVSQIVTFGTLASKAAIKDVGRVFNMPYADVDRITKLMPKMMGKNKIEHILGLKPPKNADEKVAIPELVDMYNTDPQVKRVLDMAMRIEGMPRQTGIHAAGVIICRDILSDHIPLALSAEKQPTTEFNMIECEELGLLKMDFLGLTTVTDIENAKKIIKKTRGVDIDFYGGMDYNDANVFKLISSGDTHAVFQLESEGMKRFMRDLKPTSIEDIIAGISLYRPGPLDKIPEYVHNKKHPEDIVYAHPLLEPILNVTYGVMVYQEQVMKIVQELAGYSLGNADIVRRNMSKKKVDAMIKERKIFLHGGTNKDGSPIVGCIKNGVSEDVANKIFDEMMSFASYAFNKSHAAAYGYLAYQTAYLKEYYTVEFIAAVLNNRITSIEEITNYLSYLKEKGYQVLPPDINKSFGEFSVEDGKVRIGMAAIKNVGINAIDAIVAEREKNGDYTDFVSFVKRMENGLLNKKQLESLIYAGTFDCFGKTRSQLISVYEQIYDRVNKDRQARLKGQLSFFDLAGTPDDFDRFDFPDIKEYDLSLKLKKEKEVSGVYLSGHPLDQYTEYMKKFSYNTSMFKYNDEGDDQVADDSNVTVGGILSEVTRGISKKSGKEYAKAKLEDRHGTIDLIVSGFTLNKFRDAIVNDSLVTVSGRLKLNEDGSSISVNSVEKWSGENKTLKRKICIYVSFNDCTEDKIDEIQNVLKAYPGVDESYMKNLDNDKLYPLKIDTSINNIMLKELGGIVGIDNVKVV